VAGASFGMGEALSPPVRRAVRWAVRAVVRQAQAWNPAATALPAGEALVPHVT
jgi:hypothetical protein